MQTRILSINSPYTIPHILSVLEAGGLVAFPTDTVYGVGALAFNSAAVESIYTAKGRSIEKAIPVLLGDAKDLDKVASNVSPMALRLASRFWPGPLTLVVPKNPMLPEAVSANDTVGVRVPDNAIARTLLRSAGPMAVTSANISGGNNPTTSEEVFAQLNGRIGLILDGGRTLGGRPSTVVDCIQREPSILREGPISLEEIKSALFQVDNSNTKL
jgi:L-threonylcarbamoyladenylate synthase